MGTLRLLPTFRGLKKSDFFYLTKFKFVILTCQFPKKNIKNLKKPPSYLEKDVFSNKVNKPRRCYNLVNGRDSWGNFLGKRSSLVFPVICIFLFISRT